MCRVCGLGVGGLTLLVESTLPHSPSMSSSPSIVRSSPLSSNSWPRALRPSSAHSTMPLRVRYRLVTNWLRSICRSLLLGGTTTSTDVLLEASTYMIFCRWFSRKDCTARKRWGRLVVSLRSALRVQSSSTFSFSASAFQAAHIAEIQRSRTPPTSKRSASSSLEVDPVSGSRSEASSFAAVPTRTRDLDR